MASEEINAIRKQFHMDPEPPKIWELPHDDPTTPSEFYENAVVVIHNRAELGEITTQEAYDLLHEMEDERAAMGDGWEDRYGPAPDFSE